MVRTALATGILLTFMANGAFADDAAGMAAFRRGDISTAVREWTNAAQKGDPNAEVNLGVLYAKGKGVEQDLGQAMNLYTLAADQGNALAQYLLGEMYAKGWGLPDNNAQTMQLSQMLATQGNNDAAGVAGSLSETGIGYGLQADQTLAVYYFRLAALHGLPVAQFRLGQMLEQGKGLKRNPAEAFHWFSSAAEHGNGPAAGALSVAYAKGEGVQADPEKALFWMDVALKAQDKGLDKYRRQMSSKLSQDEVSRAANEANSWKPLPANNN
jgi:uncharacterized protein